MMRGKEVYRCEWSHGNDIFPSNPRLAEPLLLKGYEYEPLAVGELVDTLWELVSILKRPRMAGSSVVYMINGQMFAKTSRWADKSVT